MGDSCASTVCAKGLVCVEAVCAYPPLDAETSVNDAGVHDAAIGDGSVVIGDGSVMASDAAVVEDAGTSCGPCTTPPDGCHAVVGSCQAGACVYDVVPGASCDDGNPCTVNDTCSQAGVCTGVAKICTTPPVASCNGSDSTTYDQSGSCNGGLCVYTMHTTTCAHGCSNGTCGADACSGVTCTMPPSGCYKSAGTCASGSCSYAYNDGATCDDGNACTTSDSCATGVCQGVPKACNTPPANTCKDTNTAQIYSSVGSCSVGTCSYSYGYMACSNGCANGACNSSGWTSMTSGTTKGLYSVWGTSANAVWAGGVGVMLYYNGVSWQQRSTGFSSTDWIVSLHGTSASNIFAAVFDGTARVVRYDGTSWSAGVPLPGNVYAASVYAIGSDDALVFSVTNTGSTLYRLTSGTLTTITQTSYAAVDRTPTPTLAARSATDVYLPGTPPQHWDGTKLTTAGKSTDSAIEVEAVGASIYGSDGQTVETYGTAWSSLGYNATNEILAVGGTSASRLFAVGGDYTTAFVAAYDGMGWSTATLPTTKYQLNALYAAPTGQVFTVGLQGTIFVGP